MSVFKADKKGGMMYYEKKQTFALYFGNRGFMPAELIKDARKEMMAAVEKGGL